MSEIDPTVIKCTQGTLGKFVKKPQLTEKLLSKPPFRFLHDVFNVVIKETGCFRGLYSTEELAFENIKDRDDKMKFLQKMIDVVKLTTGKAITVRTSKIVAGQEPEKTNELLQLMAEIIESKSDWKAAVEQLKAGKVSEQTAVASKQKTQDKPSRSEKQKIDKNNKQKVTKIKDVKVGSKTISPSTKPTPTEKSVSKSTKEVKEKTVKTTKDIASTDSKEKALKKTRGNTEDSKLSKTKTGSDEKTPSPLKNEVNDKKLEKPIKRKQSIEHTEDRQPNFNVKEIVNVEIKSGSPTLTTDKLIPRRNTETIQNSLISAAAKVGNVEAVIQNDVVEVRKSPVQRKHSPGSANRYEAHGMQEKNDSVGVDTLKEDTPNSTHVPENRQIQRQSPKHEINETTAAPVPAPAPTPTKAATSPMPTDAGGNDVKRESTFTRENSRDSTDTSNMNNRPRTSLRPPSARPASARPGAPRRRDRNVEIVLQPNDSVTMSGINVRLETFGDLEDDGENLVIIEDANVANMTNDQQEITSADVMNGESNLEQQGHLVQQILETQKDLMQQNSNEAAKNEKEKDLTKNLNGRQSSARQMNNLRDIIQNLTKSVNPFGKLMDFIPEDIDAMQLELTMWRDTYTQVANELKREKSLTESAIEPMKNQLVQIEASIKEYIEMIDASRTKILQNTEKILKMLTEQ